MAKLSQKELLGEGITGLIGKGLKKGAQAVGAVGGALKAATDAGINAGVGNLIRGGKAGYEKTEDLLTSRNEKLLKVLDGDGVMVNPKKKIKYSTNKKIAIIDVIPYDFADDDDIKDDENLKLGEKIPVKGEESKVVKYRFKDDNWEKITGTLKSKESKTEGKPFEPKVGQEVLVRTKKSPTGEAGVVKRLNPNGRITIATAGNKAGYAFDPKNVLPSPRIKNEKSSQIDLLRQLTLI
jgi:hypothetical protein